MKPWIFNKEYDCWEMRDVPYTQNLLVPEAQRLSIFVPRSYIKDGKVNSDGVCANHTAKDAPVIFENNSAGYFQMPNVFPGNGRCNAEQFLNQGYVWVSMGNRGSDSVDKDGKLCGKSPANLVDLKMALRFLRHHRNEIPGDMDKVISTGWSAGGAMSTLLAVTGNNKNFDSYLEEAGAYMDESDSVYAAQIYCPITDLNHADLAYEWMFAADDETEESPAGPAEKFGDFKKALSKKLKEKYIEYFNSMEYKSIEDGSILKFGEDGRSGSAYDYYMKQLCKSATEFLTKFEAGEDISSAQSLDDYMDGNYRYTIHRRFGDIELQGDAKRNWLTWDGKEAKVSSLDEYVLGHRRRMKGCTSFDTFGAGRGENRVFGTNEEPDMHFDRTVGEALEELKDEFPNECKPLLDGFKRIDTDEELRKRIYLYNPYSYIGTEEKCDQCRHYRICVGGQDADTSHTISMGLACKLAEYYDDVTYKIIWDKPHCPADYEGDVVKWIESII